MAISKGQARLMVEVAELAGNDAANRATPTPMLVYEAGLDDRPIPDARAWHVPEGVCGFAWVNVKPGNSRIARALKEHGAQPFNARTDSYYGGVSVWVGVGGQSHARKVAAANAYATVIEQFARDNGERVTVWVGDRLD